jgi:hypothetical protein
MRTWATVEVQFGSTEPWLRIKMETGEQTIALKTEERRLGGHQWYFLCPMTSRLSAVLWKPHGQTQFASQQYSKQRKALYRTQSMSRYDRADRGIKRIEARLVYSEDDDMLHKPKWT